MPKVSLVLDKRRQLKDGTYPIKLRLTDVKDRKYYALGYNVSISDFDKKIMDLSCDVRGSNRIIRDKIFKIQNRALEIINSLSDFSFTLFESVFLKQSGSLFVFESMQEYEEEVRTEGRASTASTYSVARKSFEKFIVAKGKKKKPKFGDITVAWLNAYESWMLCEKSQKKPMSWSTIGINTRNLRKIFNRAIDKKIINKTDIYPFGKGRYEIPSSVNVKKALTFDQVNDLYSYDCSATILHNKPYDVKNGLANMEKWRDIWILSYLCNGVNFRDIASWKWRNYKEGKLNFIREKTLRTKRRNIEPIIILLSPEAKEIFFKYCVDSRMDSDYIFPFFNDEMSSDRKLAVCRQQIKNLNKWVGRISDNLEFEVKATFQRARHSYSSISRNAGVTVDYISQSLGHQNLETTKNYLDSFEEKKIIENQSYLLKKKRTYLNAV